MRCESRLEVRQRSKWLSLKSIEFNPFYSAAGDEFNSLASSILSKTNANANANANADKKKTTAKTTKKEEKNN